MKPTNVTRWLDKQKILYQSFELPQQKLGAIEAAKILGVPLEQMCKTIVLVQEAKKRPVLAVIPGTSEVDPKQLAIVLGVKKMHLATEKEAERITGLKAGGISPLALINRGFLVVLDESILRFHQIYVSGGVRGLNIRLSPDDLITLTNAEIGDITRG